MTRTVDFSRRAFLKTAALAAGGLVVGFYLPVPAVRGSAVAAPESGGAFAPNAFIRIAGDDTVTIIIGRSEMGQGVYTALPMIVAEELDADWSTIRVEASPVDPAYNNPAMGAMVTGGSTSVPSSWEPLRKAGATARRMLIDAAAEDWGVKAADLRTENGFVIHDARGRRAGYGTLAGKAARLEPPENVALKDPKDFKLIGQSVRRLEGPDKVTGRAQFGLDVQLPGMLTAVIVRPPQFGGRVKGFNPDKALAVRGVKQVKPVTSGVAVIADSFWNAKTGAAALEVEWIDGPEPELSSAGLFARYAELATRPGAVAGSQGDAATAMAGAAKRIDAAYQVPYLAHATMEPLNCTAQVRPDGCEVWTGTQMQTMDRMLVAKLLDLKPEQVRIHTLLLGGGFGRRANPRADFVVEAVEVARGLEAPVKTVWTREDDMRGGWYRPLFHHAFEAGLDEQGKPVAWRQRIVGQSIIAGTPFEKHLVRDGIDEISVEGARDMPYKIANQRIELHTTQTAVPVLWWRSVGHTHTAFANECFLDEIAHAGGRDPYELRRELLGDDPRHRAVLDLAADKAGWGTPLPQGRARGIALRKSFDSYVAEVVEVSLDQGGKVKVHRVVAAVDCGLPVNPLNIQAQVEGAIVFGLTAALYGEITLDQGRAQQSNFHDYKMLRINEMPQIEVHIVPSREPPTGIGEPGVPPLAPALCNALFALTGKRIRSLPLSRHGLA